MTDPALLTAWADRSHLTPRPVFPTTPHVENRPAVLAAYTFLRRAAEKTRRVPPKARTPGVKGRPSRYAEPMVVHIRTLAAQVGPALASRALGVPRGTVTYICRQKDYGRLRWEPGKRKEQKKTPDELEAIRWLWSLPKGQRPSQAGIGRAFRISRMYVSQIVRKRWAA